VLVHWNNSG